MIRFEDVERKVERHHPDADLDSLRRAYIYSAKSHKDQKRESGEPYLIHPLSVVEIPVKMKMDVATVSTGLLHDVVEDTLVTIDDIKGLFGEDVAHLVDGVTKISQLGAKSKSKEDARAESLRKMILAMASDIRVVLIKLADRLHNMRTLEYLPADNRKRIAQETREVYAPIAHRLGMSKIRAELEELAFQYLEPDEYKRLKDEVEERRASTEAFLDEVKTRIAGRLTEEGVHFVRVEGRIKRLYSIYLKLKKQKTTLDKVYDLAAVRIITREEKDCYFALGVMHKYWKPFQDRIKDLIAMPRENGYRSLHTSVVGDEGYHFEVQIRTEEMHNIAEEGIAAHWKYKEGKGKDTSDDEAMKWMRRLAEWQQDVSDAREFVDSFKLDLYPKDVHALTPKGKIIKLPLEATPIDFAYAIHTEIGDQCTGAKVNRRIVPLRYQIQNGDVIEIMTTPGHKPSRDWLNFVKTTKARGKIKRWIAERQRGESVEVGRKLFEKEAVKLRLKTKKVLEDPQLAKFLNDNGYARLDDMFAAIGYGKLMARTVLIRFVPPENLAEVEQAKTSKLQRVTESVKRALRLGDDRILIKGIDDIMVYRAPCCSPIRGEEVIGYITRGKGVSVHSQSCPNVTNLMYDPERRIAVEWQRGVEGAYEVRVGVHVEDRPGLLAAITRILAESNTDIRNAEARTFDDRTASIELTLRIQDLKHLERVLKAIRAVSGVIDVERQSVAR